jgi:Asp/Glu/hydantoin racemase
VTSLRPVHVPITEMTARRDELRERFVAGAREAVALEGAELVLPLGLTMLPVLLRAADLADELGVPVLDPLQIAMHLAATLARGGVTNSRVAYPEVLEP